MWAFFRSQLRQISSIFLIIIDESRHNRRRGWRLSRFGSVRAHIAFWRGGKVAARRKERQMCAKWSLELNEMEKRNTLCVCLVLVMQRMCRSCSASSLDVFLNFWGQQTDKSPALHSLVDRSCSIYWHETNEGRSREIMNSCGAVVGEFDSNLMDINVYCLPFMFLFVGVCHFLRDGDGSLWKVKQAIELGQFTESRIKDS